MQIRAHHWIWALCAAVSLHAAAAVAVLWTPAPPGARQAGLGGIEVSLGPAGGAPGALASAAPPPAEAEEVDPVQAERPPLPDRAAAVPPQAQPENTVEPAEVVPVQMAEAVEPVQMAEAVEPPRAPPAKVPPPPKAKPKPPEPKQVRRLDPPEPKPVEQTAAAPVEAKPVKSPPAEQIANAQPSIAGAGGKAGDKAKPGTGSGDMTAGGGAPGAAADYMAVLRAWLEKHKEYPRAARLRRIEGTVLLYFVVGDNGEVYADRIEKTSGHSLLDEEAIAMIRRARPLPPMPESMNRDRLEVVVPVQFFLR